MVVNSFGEMKMLGDSQVISRLEELIARGYASAMFNRALMHEKGFGGAINVEEAIRLYELAIQKGHRGATNNLAMMRQKSLGGVQNSARVAGTSTGDSGKRCVFFTSTGKQRPSLPVPPSDGVVSTSCSGTS